MAFNSLTVYMFNGADIEKDCNILKAKNYNLYSVCVQNQKEALTTCIEYAQEKNIDSIMLCPGFTNIEAGEIDKAVGDKINVCIARCDSSMATMTAVEKMQKENLF
ncbi:MAG: hypothetical protein GY756_24550 [bacterium]|nr:hypothetical protein [bacterium]